MMGVYLLTRTEPGKLDWMGVVLMIASAATYGWHIVLGQWVLADVSSRTAALYILTTMACVVGIARVLQARPLETLLTTGWFTILGLGLTTALSRLTMFSALELLGGVETSIAGPMELLVSLVLALLLLGDRLTGVQWIGGALLMLSLWLMSRDRGMRLAEGNVPLEWRQE